MATSPGDRLSQALNGGSGSALVSSTSAVSVVADVGAQVVSDLVFRRFRSLRILFTPAAFAVKKIDDAWVAVVSCSDPAYSGWNTAMVFPSGSLNQADRPMPGVETT